MKLAIHKVNKFCCGLACEGQTDFDEIEVNSIPESFLDSNHNYKYKWNSITEELEEADFKQENEYKQLREKEIDNETYKLIKDWCLQQAKCEEYYLRQERASTDFIAYNTQAESLIATQHQKKVDEGII